MNFKYIRDKLGFLIHNPALDETQPVNLDIPPMVRQFDEEPTKQLKDKVLIEKTIEEKLADVRLRYGEQGYNLERDTTLFAMRPVGKEKINNMSSSGKGYVFFGRPDLNMFNNFGAISEGVEERTIANRNPLVHDTDLRNKVKRNLLVSRLLDRTNGDRSSYRRKVSNATYKDSKLIAPHFLPLLSNCIDSFNTPDKTLSVTESNKTIFGAHVKYPLHNEGDVSNASISMTFNETKDNDVYHLFDMWTHYMASNRRGICSPRIDYIKKGETDYDIPIYVFITDEDGMTITWWCKYISSYPISVPSGSYDVAKGQTVSGHKQHSITFNTARFEPTGYSALDKDLITMWYKSGNMGTSNNTLFVKYLTKIHSDLHSFNLGVSSYGYELDYSVETTREYTRPNPISTTPENGYRVPIVIKVQSNVGSVSHKLVWLIKN